MLNVGGINLYKLCFLFGSFPLSRVSEGWVAKIPGRGHKLKNTPDGRVKVSPCKMVASRRTRRDKTNIGHVDTWVRLTQE